MPFCPQCKTVFKEDVMTCRECEEDLLPVIVPSQIRESVD